jgi:hypothetical protein
MSRQQKHSCTRRKAENYVNHFPYIHTRLDQNSLFDIFWIENRLVEDCHKLFQSFHVTEKTVGFNEAQQARESDVVVVGEVFQIVQDDEHVAELEEVVTAGEEDGGD